MDSAEDKQSVPGESPAPENGNQQEQPAVASTGESALAGSGSVQSEQTTDATDTYNYYDDYGYDNYPSTELATTPEPAAVPAVSGSGSGSPPGPPPAEDEDADEDGMLRMSFMEHLEELRVRIIRSLMGLGVAFVISLYFVNDLWEIISQPAVEALRQNGVQNPGLAMLKPTEAFSVIWVKLPILTSIFISSPWILYQVWSFIAPGLYKRERKWASPFILCTAGLFICGGLFAYFVAFRLGLAFLLGIGLSQNLQAVVSITEYFDLFVNVTLGLGLVFELPVLIFFLSLLRILTPQFLIRNSRYAILLIVVIAAIITPTPDVVNLILISGPMTVLYFAGVFASYLLWLSRENKRFPWLLTLFLIFCLLIVIAGGTYLAVAKYGYQLVLSWPFLVR
jgi:sec-independent protein translocase protein TatC